MRLTWLPGVLRDAGLDVVEVPGWESRGREMGSVNGVVIHDTVTTASTSDDAVARLLRDGRPDLAGPLSQLGLDRRERLWVVASGRANHNGYGRWGNDAVGIEVFCAGGLAGREEPQTEGQQQAGAAATAAILDHLGLPRDRCLGHKETDPNRKIDPYRVDMDRYRQMVAEGEPMPSEEYFDLHFLKIAIDQEAWARWTAKNVAGHDTKTDKSIRAAVEAEAEAIRAEIKALAD